MITTVQCSICSQLNNKPRVVVRDFRLQYMASLTKWWLLELTLQPTHIQPRCKHAHLIHVHVHYIYIADMRTKEVSKINVPVTSEQSVFS